MRPFSFSRSPLVWTWLLIVTTLVWAWVASISTASSLSYRGYVLSSKHCGLSLSLQHPLTRSRVIGGPSFTPPREGLSSTPIPDALKMGLRWRRPLYIKRTLDVPVSPPPSPRSPSLPWQMPTPPPPDTWWEDHWRDYSNEEHFIFEIRNLGHQGDFLLYLPYWLILVVITPPWWALILWVACRHEKAVELASGQGEIPAAPEPGET